jgi:glycosyltransferase involved in cell wall biosynthesis
LNIALVSMDANPLGPPGGREGSGQGVLVDGLARALGALGHRLTVYGRWDESALPARISAAPNVSVVYLDPGSPARTSAAGHSVDALADGLADAWASDPPETIHTFGLASGKAAHQAAQGGALPLVQTFHPLISRGRGRDKLLAARFEDQATIVRAAARIVAISSSQVFALLRLGASPAAISFVPCGVDLERFAPGPRSERAATGRLRVATLSGLHPSQGVAEVVEALAYVDGVDLVIGGGLAAQPDIFADPDAARLHALAHALKVAGRVEFRGHVGREEAAAFLRSADVVVCTPHADAIGTAALEAMACGIPLVVSTVGGLVDAVTDGMTGIHVPPRAARQIAHALEALRVDPARRERLGRFAAERTATRYGWARIAADTSEVYRSVARSAARMHRGLA